jgi:murein DD-endopeptidase MepM/ murein hydrolase activator NlpD
MGDKKIQIIIPGKNGRERSIYLHKIALYTVVAFLGVSFLVLSWGSVLSSRYFLQNKELQKQTAQLSEELRDNTIRLNRQLTNARIELARIRQVRAELIARYEQQVNELKEDQKALLETTITRLDERARVIETVIDKLGVKLDEDPGHSGGPFIALDDKLCNKLICDTGRYLDALQKMPLGLPIHTKISSGFGRRIDPLNKHRSFHAGIDFKGNTGDKIRATGNGTVKKSAYNRSLGHYVIISHGNGYETTFAHLSRRLVQRGDKIERGQVIGLLGNTGRSTGSHLHYEVRHYGKPVNPMKYMRVADLAVSSKR